MRVYVGGDHGAYELKQSIIEHLAQAGHEPIDCGAYVYVAEDDYPAFCIAAAQKTGADPGSLGIVLGGSGNGEQMAANTVPGARCALDRDILVVDESHLPAIGAAAMCVDVLEGSTVVPPQARLVRPRPQWRSVVAERWRHYRQVWSTVTETPLLSTLDEFLQSLTPAAPEATPQKLPRSVLQ